MKVANFRKSLSRGFILSMGLLSLRSQGNPLRSTCNKSMHPTERTATTLKTVTTVRKLRTVKMMTTVTTVITVTTVTMVTMVTTVTQ